MRLTDIVSNQNGNDSNPKGINRSKGGIVKIIALALGITAFAAFNPSKSYAMDQPNPYLQIGGCTAAGFLVGNINYFLFAKPKRLVNESLQDYQYRCNKAYWLCTGIHTGAGLGAGITWYAIDKKRWDDQEANKKKINDPDSMNPIPPEQFGLTGFDLKLDGKTVYFGISGRF